MIYSIIKGKGIAIQSDERGKVFDNLMATVKKYMSHESETFAKITALRGGKGNGKATR